MVDGLKLVQVIDTSGARPDSIVQDAIDYWCNIPLLKIKTNRFDRIAGMRWRVSRRRIGAGGTNRQQKNRIAFPDASRQTHLGTVLFGNAIQVRQVPLRYRLRLEYGISKLRRG